MKEITFNWDLGIILLEYGGVFGIMELDDDEDAVALRMAVDRLFMEAYLA